jgi:hypothetical protein
MATYRGQEVKDTYDVGLRPPLVRWTVVKGDTAAFRVYVQDDAGVPLVISEWTIALEIKRPNLAINKGVITDDATAVTELYPIQTTADSDGEFTVFLNSINSGLVETGDIFDIELTDGFRIWTVAQGSFVVLEDVTN